MRHVLFSLHELGLRVERHDVDANGRRVADVRRHLSGIRENYAPETSIVHYNLIWNGIAYRSAGRQGGPTTSKPRESVRYMTHRADKVYEAMRYRGSTRYKLLSAHTLYCN